MAKQERKLWVLLAAFTATVAFGLGCLYVHSQNLAPGPPQSRNQRTAIPLAPASPGSLQENKDDFSEAMARLNTAFQARSGIAPERIMARANAAVPQGAARPCPFEWKNEEASLLLRLDAHGELPLTQTINHCVDSIESLRAPVREP